MSGDVCRSLSETRYKENDHENPLPINEKGQDLSAIIRTGLCAREKAINLHSL